MRIAIAGLSIEIMLSSPVPVGAGEVQHYSAKDILEGDVWMIRGMLQRLAEDPDIEAVPLCWMTALPAGALDAEAYAAIKAETLGYIRDQGPFDGILLANHGALEVEGLDGDADTDFVRSVRDFAGPDVPIGIALDLHGDMTPGLLEAATVFSVLRTAPHRDDRETGYRAADQLVKVLRTGIRPKKAAVSIPILVPGETAVTALSPARELYGSLPDYDARDGLMEANILVGFAWNDRPWTSVTAFAVAEESTEIARKAALDLAADIWAEREGFRLNMETAELVEGLKRAWDAEKGPVFLTDSGDNTTAGAAGDLTYVLQTVIDMPEIDDIIVAGITGPETVAKCIAAGVGSTVTLDLGAEHRSRPPQIRTVEAVVEAAGEALELGGFQPYRSKEAAWARVRIGNVVASFHARSIGVTTPAHFEAMGIHPTAHKIYVVKLGYLHPQLEDIAARTILLLTDGTAQLDMTKLEWTVIPRPMHPLDKNIAWSPESGLYGDR